MAAFAEALRPFARHQREIEVLSSMEVSLGDTLDENLLQVTLTNPTLVEGDEMADTAAAPPSKSSASVASRISSRACSRRRSRRAIRPASRASDEGFFRPLFGFLTIV